MVRFKNIPIGTIRKYLLFKGLKHIRTTGGHEIWGGKSLQGPIVLQTHIDPVPEFIVKQILRTLSETEKGFMEFLQM